MTLIVTLICEPKLLNRNYLSEQHEAILNICEIAPYMDGLDGTYMEVGQELQGVDKEKMHFFFG